MNRPNPAMLIVFVFILLLALCASLAGCYKYRARDYNNDQRNSNYFHRCDDYWFSYDTITSPALSVTPRLIKPRFHLRRWEYPAVPPEVPLIVPPMDHSSVVPQSSISNSDTDADTYATITAYASLDRAISIPAAQ